MKIGYIKSILKAMKAKKIFTADYELHASIKMLYPYIHSASGLAAWFADDVRINNEDKVYTFVWDNEHRRARLASHRTNVFARFEFLPEDGSDEVNAFFELRLEHNELTQSVYLKITDQSDTYEGQELQDVWDGLVDNLRKTVGG
jgi:uncharacterized protein YndB with AHSA1/START domain